MSWNENTGIIASPVSMSDIRAAVNYNSLDLGELVRYGDINMWSKAKPVRYPSWTQNGGATDGELNPYGIYIPSSASDMSCVAQTLAYRRPQGGSASPFRMLDFDGYNAQSIRPWSNILMPSGNIAKSATSAAAAVKFMRESFLPTGNMTISDLYPGKYFCVGIGSYFKTIDANESMLSFADCPAFQNAAIGSQLTIRCAMTARRMTSWTYGPETTFYTLSNGSEIYESTITLTETVVSTWSLVAAFPNNRRVFTNGTTTQSGNDLFCTVGWRLRPAKDYELVSITYGGTKRYSGTTVADVTVPLAQASGIFLPTEVLKADYDEAGGQGTVTLRCQRLESPQDEPVEWNYRLNYQ